jgi:dCTP deaminase
MILCQRDMKKAMSVGDLIISPLPNDSQFSTSALDLRVGEKFYTFKKNSEGIEETVDFDLLRETAEKYKNLDRFLERVVPTEDEVIVLKRNGFMLMETLEKIKLPLEGQLAARVEGRSSLARIGISVHMTAPTIHCGWSGPIYLEVKNEGPFHLKIHPRKTLMCQLIFERVSSIPHNCTESIFLNQNSPTGKT